MIYEVPEKIAQFLQETLAQTERPGNQLFTTIRRNGGHMAGKDKLTSNPQSRWEAGLTRGRATGSVGRREPLPPILGGHPTAYCARATSLLAQPCGRRSQPGRAHFSGWVTVPSALQG